MEDLRTICFLTSAKYMFSKDKLHLWKKGKTSMQVKWFVSCKFNACSLFIPASIYTNKYILFGIKQYCSNYSAERPGIFLCRYTWCRRQLIEIAEIMLLFIKAYLENCCVSTPRVESERPDPGFQTSLLAAVDSDRGQQKPQNRQDCPLTRTLCACVRRVSATII